MFRNWPYKALHLPSGKTWEREATNVTAQQFLAALGNWNRETIDWKYSPVEYFHEGYKVCGRDVRVKKENE